MATRASLATIGVIALLAGGAAWAYTNAAATACGSALIAALAPSQCNAYSTVHGLGLAAAAAGVVLIVAAVVRSGGGR